MKRTILLSLTLLLLTIPTSMAQEMTPEIKEFLATIDGASLEEIEVKLAEGIDLLEGISAMISVPESVGIVDYKVHNMEEKFDDPFKIDTSVISKAMLQFDGIGFRQFFKNGKSFVKFHKIDDNYWNTIWMEDGISEGYSPKAIHYNDGTIVSEGISDNRTSFIYEELWGKIAVIDSIDIDYTIKYTAKYDSLVLTKKSKKIDYKDGFIKVNKFEKNFLSLTISDAYADGVYVNALNADGKVLNSNSRSFSPTSDDPKDDGIFEILKILEDVQGKLKAKKFKDSEALKKYFIQRVDQIEVAKDTDGVYHKKFYFEGNIETVKLFIESESNSKTVSFTATNTSGFGDVILMQNKTHNIFYDANANELFKLKYSPIYSLGSRYFRNDNLFYHLDLKNKTLDKLDVFRVWQAPNGLAFIQTTKEEKYKLYNDEHELVSEIGFDGLYTNDDQYVQGVSNEENYILDAKGSIKKLEGISDIREPFDGRLAAKKNDMFGFITASGEVAIPFVYIDAENFNDGMAIVAKEEYKYGLIDTTGKTVIPLIYFGVMSYENGIVWVSTGEGYELIDITGKVLVTAKGSSYSVGGSGLDKTYKFGDKKYDAFGKLINSETPE